MTTFYVSCLCNLKVSVILGVFIFLVSDEYQKLQYHTQTNPHYELDQSSGD